LGRNSGIGVNKWHQYLQQHLKIELIGTGDQSGTWGNTTNTNLGTALEEAIVGRATATFASDADLTLTLTNSNATQVARNLVSKRHLWGVVNCHSGSDRPSY
jgi:putative salt-induced outer membrane protein YdiY